MNSNELRIAAALEGIREELKMINLNTVEIEKRNEKRHQELLTAVKKLSK